jgi:hypothetical protein
MLIGDRGQWDGRRNLVLAVCISQPSASCAVCHRICMDEETDVLSMR